MICCLNSSCHNPPQPDGTEFCSNCGVPLIVLRHYRPIRVLGSGGFGKTYLAEDVEKFNELCVIKQFAPQIQGGGALQKATELFEQEARRLQHLGDHPQIPTLLAYFEQEHRLYLVQQFIDGENLFEELQQQGSFSEQKIWELLLDLLNILKTVHEQKVIHRDIKPQNILRRKSSSATKGNIILIDFGASKQLSETVISQPGTTIGSFGYAPLEQMQDGQAYPASDLYSLGATCFHLLTGVPPWELWKQQGYGWVGNWRSHLQQSVSQKLGTILDKLLQPNYEERYQSAEDVLQDVNDGESHSQMPATIAHPRPVSPRSPELVPTVNYQIPSSPRSPEVPTTVNYQPLPSTSVDLLKPKPKLKLPLLVSGAILLLGLGGYGVWQVSKSFLPQTIAYEKLALANTLDGHNGQIYALAVSGDSQTLISGSADKTIKVWNLPTGDVKTTISLNSDAITSLAISRDSKTLFSGSKDGNIKIWNLPTGTLKTTLPKIEDSVSYIALSPDEQTLVSGGDNKIKIWNLLTGKLKNTLTGHTKSVMAVAISPDGKTLVSGSEDNNIKIWDLPTGQLKNTLTGHTKSVMSVVISPDGETLASGSSDDTIKIWNLQTGKLKHTLTEHYYPVSALAISPNGETLASGSWDYRIKIWNLKTGAIKATLLGHRSAVNSLVITPDGQSLISGSNNRTIKIWRVP
ncbi:protein kinase [Calothrix sp. NIES-2100]|uniref:serine/threonine-protein kinase n=1 Tax=Calothrix sp. NIES-2100 TaxID=1954172 RepID=UPI000B5EF4DE|nr:protein kinase [Calothrix sp. NIES-2100]